MHVNSPIKCSFCWHFPYIIRRALVNPQKMDIVDPNPITVENIIDDPAPDPSSEEDLRSDHDPFKDTLKLN